MWWHAGPTCQPQPSLPSITARHTSHRPPETGRQAATAPPMPFLSSTGTVDMNTAMDRPGSSPDLLRKSTPGKWEGPVPLAVHPSWIPEASRPGARRPGRLDDAQCSKEPVVAKRMTWRASSPAQAGSQEAVTCIFHMSNDSSSVDICRETLNTSSNTKLN